ncbi:MAG: hypothetical protein IKA17_05255 [Clostridia bacterium]|nr:hypothetical protein [Clostridia bacterium]
MKKIIALVIVMLMASSYSLVCRAETLLTYYDTVVIKPNLDVTTELVLEEEKSITENHEKTSSLKDLMRKASNNFFQK